MSKAPKLNPRQVLLTTAYDIVSNDRNKQYGSPESNFGNIAALWNVYLSAATGAPVDIQPVQVAHMMILMKAARLATNPHHLDSTIDIAGYAACAADCQR